MEIVEQTIKKYKTKDGIVFNDRQDAIMHEKGIPYGKHYMKINNSTEFVVTENHLKLLPRVQIGWHFEPKNYNLGHFYQDVVRPYGNSDWIGDIAEIIGVAPDMQNPNDEDDKWFSESLEFFLVCHHIDMMVVMEILCQNLSIVAGTYKRYSPYGGKWELIIK